MNRVNHDAIPRSLRCRSGRCNTVCGVKEALVVAGVVLLVETSRQTEVGQLDMAIFVNENVVWLDITGSDVNGCGDQRLLIRTGE